ncbi:unnamed protein product [Protopolystoma xenopodis]|uniref:Uncharacterized protein n=1 Tax=Protopolystoma xenopodis TaxID=117903 RepID=A0A3S4ZWA8_9PLAT|nr:unnamed protein product [Protopolystoma xenopodis]
MELKNDDKIKEVTFLPTIQVPEIAAKKQSIVDVLCKSEKGEQIIIEMQVSPQEGFEKRAQYYAAKAYSMQLNKGSDLVIKRAYEELNQFNWTEEELFIYEQETKRIMDNRAAEDYLIKTAEARGKAEGIRIGKAKARAEKIEIARKFKQSGVSCDIIAQSTGLTKKEIEELN